MDAKLGGAGRSGPSFSRHSVDEVALSRALLEAVPELRFVSNAALRTDPEVCSIADVAAGLLTLGFMQTDLKGWRQLTEMFGQSVSTRIRSFSLSRSFWDWSLPRGAKWAWDPPTLKAGTLSAVDDKTDPEEVAFVDLVWKTMRRVMTKRFKVELPHVGHVLGEVRRPDFWAGHDALRWCREVPNRMLDGKFRPTDDWQFRDLPWYQDIPPRDVLEDVKRKGQ